MLPIFYFVFLCTNFLLIRSEGASYVTIEVGSVDNCKVNSENFKFTEGQDVTLVVQPDKYIINYGWWNVNTSTEFKELTDKLNSQNSVNHNEKSPIINTKNVDRSMAGIWEFKFYLHRNIRGASQLPIKQHTNGQNYTMSVCKTNVTIEPAPRPSKGTDTQFIIIACAAFAILVLIILAQAAYIVFLKIKAQKLITLNTHNNLSKKSESFSNDTARYCTNPRPKLMIEPIPVEEDDRSSVIYEAPNIEISSNGRMPMQPPQPPAITTMPRTPRSDHNMKVGPQSMLVSALNSPARSPTTDGLQPNFQRPKHIEREINVANRPPLPLPTQDHPHETYQELYEEMETEEDNYMPPPALNTMPPRLPMPTKKVPTGNLLGVKESSLNIRQGSNKPPITPKPQLNRTQTIAPANVLEQALRKRNNERETTLPRSPTPGHTMQPQHQQKNQKIKPTGTTGDAQINELQEALKRRNNVMQVPVVSIPDPSSRSSPSPKPIPPPVQKSKPPPMRHPVQKEIYYNEASSDEEEWTYEPLKPLNSYDQNIYNV